MTENLFLLFFITSVVLWLVSTLLYRSKRAWRLGTLTFCAGAIALNCELLTFDAESSQPMIKIVLSVVLLLLYLWLSVFSLKEKKPEKMLRAKQP